jgi:hypothetical protein
MLVLAWVPGGCIRPESAGHDGCVGGDGGSSSGLEGGMMKTWNANQRKMS